MTCRDIVPLGQNKSNFNYNLDEKRVLNFENVVDDSDNVKQDMSIDVYGRKKDDEEADDTSKAATKDKVDADAALGSACCHAKAFSTASHQLEYTTRHDALHISHPHLSAVHTDVLFV